MISKLSHRAVAGGLLAVLAFAGAACGDDDEPTETGDAPTTTVAEETTTTAQDGTTTTAGDDEGAADVVTIIGTNDADGYRFEDVPTEAIPAGTKLSLQNTGTEPHELVLIRIPDEETRPVGDLVSLSDEELGEVFGGEPEPSTVLLAATGTTDTPGAVLGDGTVTEPGRYAVLCFLPVGSTDDVLESDGPPEDSTAPPHAALGMYAELTVE